MALELTVSKGGFSREENRWYPGIIDHIEETDHSQYGAGLQWFILLDDDKDSAYPETWAFSSQTISPGSKVHAWITGIYGQAPEVGVVVDLGKLFGVRVGIQFAAHSTNPDRQVVSKFKGLDEPREEPETPPVTNYDFPF